MAGRIVAWRRDLHRHPGIAWQEEWASHYLREHFKKLGVPVKKMAGTGLRAVVKGRPGGKTVALRTDMDALPLEEEGNKVYRSLNPGAAHSCAHDGHMAVMMAAAELLARRKGAFKGNVVFVCQPAEEHPPGGAIKMIEEGALEGVDGIFGLHFWQPLPTGTLGIVRGPMMAQSDNIWITVKGRAGHGALPHTAIDPVFVAAQLVVGLQSVVSRNVDPLKPAVLTFGAVHGGTANNIIPAEVKLTGTVRTLDLKVQALMKKRIREVAEATCAAFGAAAEVVYEEGYPVLVNDPASVDLVAGVAKRALGEESLLAIDPLLGGEDFARYLQEIPGAFFFFGAGDGTKYPHHHPAFDFDEKALAPAAFLMTALALEYLA